MPQIMRKLFNRIRYRKFQDDLAEELALHRELKARELHGTNHHVSRAMGNELRMREQAREVWIPPSFDALRQDLRDALRLIGRRPLFTVMSIAALLVGVGSATVAFALLNTLILRPLPVDRPEELVYLDSPSFSFPIIREVRARSTFFSNSFGWNLEQHNVMWGSEPEPTLVMQVSGSMYETLGVRPFLGRLLSPSDEGNSSADAQPVAVLSFGAWQRRFGSDPSVIGRVLRVQQVPMTIVGVSPANFFGVAPGRAPEVTVPLTLTPRLRPDAGDVLTLPSKAWLHFMGRLRPGMTIDQAQPEFQVIWRQVLEATTSPTLPADRRAMYLGRRTALMPGVTGFSSVRNQFRNPLMIVAGLAVLLLMIGCATVANMLIAGTWGRSRELAVRLALGCSRQRLARQLLCEGIGLATIAALAALALTPHATRALTALLTTTVDPVSVDPAIDWRVAVFSVTVVLFTAIVFSAAPIIMALRVQPGPALKTGARQVSSQGGLVGRAIVTVQVALSVVLLVGAALLLRSLSHLLAVDPGFDPARLLIVQVDPAQMSSLATGEHERATELNLLYPNILESLHRVPGIVSASLSMYPPISDEDGAWTESVAADGGPMLEERTRTFFNSVSPGFFTTLRTQLIAGRDFNWSDRQGAERVAIVNETLAARVFPGQNPLGRRITVGRDASRADLRIVGLVADAKYQRLQEPTRSIAYLPYMQGRQHELGRPLFVSVRMTSVNDERMSDVRQAIVSAAPELAPRVERLTDRIRDSLVNERLLAILAIALAGCALFLACIGLFGLMAHLVARRTREIGIRIALGASASRVLTQVLAHSMLLAGIGTTLGLTLAWACGGWIGSVLHGITPSDPTSYLLVAVVTIMVALFAGVVPARRAASVDAMEALRAE